MDTITIDELQSSLLVHEQRMVYHEDEEQALQITYEDRGGRGRGRGRARGRASSVAEEGGDNQSTKLKLNVSSVTNLEILNMNVLPGRKR